MRFLVRNFLKYRDMFAVVMFITGLPLIYYIRDGVGLAQNSSAFTAAMAVGAFGIAFLFKNLKSFENPNRVAFSLLLIFLIITFTYFLLRDRYSAVNGNFEIITYAVIFLVLVSVLFMTKESINRGFLPLAIFLSIIGAALLIYAVINDPLFAIGKRASVRFGENDEQGNPHVYGKGAFFGIILIFLSMKYLKKITIKVLPLFATFIFFLIVLIMTQTMGPILATLLFFALFFYFNFTVVKIASLVGSLLLKWYVALVLVIFIGFGIKMYIKNKDILKPVYSQVESRFGKIFKSLTTSEKDIRKKKGTIDASASGRIELINNTIETLDENFSEGRLRYIIFGNGYKHNYIDIPHLEVFDSFGLFGLLLYTILYVYMIKIAVVEMRNPQSIATEFIAYGFIYYMVLNFTGGLIIEYSRISYYALVARFVYPGANQFIKSKFSGLT